MEVHTFFLGTVGGTLAGRDVVHAPIRVTNFPDVVELASNEQFICLSATHLQ
jgi:hypothetical protein